MYTHRHTIDKPNNRMSLGASKPKGINRIPKIGYGYLSLNEINLFSFDRLCIKMMTSSIDMERHVWNMLSRDSHLFECNLHLVNGLLAPKDIRLFGLSIV
jgi:hypothetical protein